MATQSNSNSVTRPGSLFIDTPTFDKIPKPGSYKAFFVMRGQKDVNAHLRTGVAGDWANHFTPSLADYFKGATGEAAGRLGYAW